MIENKKKISLTGILITIAVLVFACIRLYGYYVPQKNVIVYLKKDSCGIIAAVGEPKSEECALHGDLRVDMTGNGYYIKLKSGKEAYFSKNVVTGLAFD